MVIKVAVPHQFKLKVIPDFRSLFFSFKNSIDFSVSFYNYHEPSIYPCL